MTEELEIVAFLRRGHAQPCECVECEAAALIRAQHEALSDLEAALRRDSRNKTVLSDTVEYHLDGQSMYQAINRARAALAQAREA